MTKNDHDIKTFQQGKFTVEIFPEGYILLNEELATGLHPKLEAILQKPQYADPNDVDLRLSAIALYAGVVLNGAYSLSERSTLCSILAGRLFHLREFPGAQDILPV